MPTTITTPPETFGPVPEANRPGHHPEVEQDKPRLVPDLGLTEAAEPGVFAFRFDPLFILAGAPFGVLPATTRIEVDDEVRIRFGPWSMRFPCADVVAVEETGPYHPWKVLGPPHLSFADLGITFATNAAHGLCLSLARPYPAIAPFGLIRHPGVTLTPESSSSLIRALER